MHGMTGHANPRGIKGREVLRTFSRRNKCGLALWMALAVTTTLWMTASTASAGGFTFPELGTKAAGRGGAYMLGANGPEVVYLNPALLTRLEGYHLTIDFSLHDLDLEFTRAGTDIDGNSYNTVENEFGGVGGSGAFPEPMLFGSADFGLDDFAFGFGIYGPNAYGLRRFPKDGPQRFVLVESKLLQVFYSLAAAWRTGGFRLGATFQLAHTQSSFKTVTSSCCLVSGNELSDENPDDDALTTLTLSELRPTGIIGIAYDVNQSLSFGLTYQLPNSIKQEGTADIEFNGILADPAVNAQLLGDKATFQVEQADVLRLSARYAHIVDNRELFDIELAATYEFWSRTEEFRINIEGPIQAGLEVPLEDDIILEKNWEDTISLRLGGDYNPNSWLSVRAGTFYETAAVPEEFTHLDFISFERFGLGAGATIALGYMDIDLAYLHIFNFERNVTNGQQEMVAPLANEDEELPIVNNGNYKSSIQTVSIGLTFHFEENDVLADTPVVRDLPKEDAQQ